MLGSGYTLRAYWLSAIGYQSRGVSCSEQCATAVRNGPSESARPLALTLPAGGAEYHLAALTHYFIKYYALLVRLITDSR